MDCLMIYLFVSLRRFEVLTGASSAMIPKYVVIVGVL